MNNQDIRDLAKETGVKHWQIAEALGIREDKFAKMLRHELKQETKEGIIKAIKSLKRKGAEK